MDKQLQVNQTFIGEVKSFYAKHSRQLPWRDLSEDTDQRFYQVLISEIMLQQTQVSRVIEKFNQWMTAFPTINSAAKAEFTDVLLLWQGLGYNRRARYLHDSLKQIASMKDLPRSEAELASLPGVGVNTAGAIRTYCFSEPAVFVETNIRTVFMYHFPDLYEESKVHDNEIRKKVASTMDYSNPREWYWALMDYGTYLKKQGFKNHMSAHYSVQTKFEGSLRQLRASIVREVLAGNINAQELKQKYSDPRFDVALESLVKDRTLGISKDRIFVSR